MGQRHEHTFGAVRERDLRVTWFGEASLSGSDRGHTWVIGAALQRESYDAEDLPQLDFTHTVPALFVQDE
ncbi:MAG: hypothetical protein HY704_13640 [Gemmatimonadetes bacterium]|nr:hypothetical protein [Gemmatimonadota bacterium]